MNPGNIFRLIIFFATIMLVVLIAWTAHTSWQRTGDLHEQLSVKQWESFQIADHLQQSILGLNNQVLRYAAPGCSSPECSAANGRQSENFPIASPRAVRADRRSAARRCAPSRRSAPPA